MMELVILHSNDTHGHLKPLPSPTPTMPQRTLGGYARRATFIAQQRAMHPNVLLLDAGDFYQGSRYWHAFDGEPDIELMNALQYDVASLGNHDFDGGFELLGARLQQANFPILCANMRVQADHPLSGCWQSSIIKELADENGDVLRVGIFGLLIDLPQLYPPGFTDHVTCLPIVETAQEMVRSLRLQCDVIIFLSHLGGEDDVEMAQAVDGIDLIIGGHSHTELEEILWVNHTPIVRSIAGTQKMGRVQLSVTVGECPTITSYQLFPLDDRYADDPNTSSLLATWDAKLPPERVLGQLITPLDTRTESKAAGESAAGNFYVDALLTYGQWAAKAQPTHYPNPTIAIAHMGTIRGDRVYAAGDFTNHDLGEYHPFPNPPLIRELTAPQLKKLLEQGASKLPQAHSIFLSFAALTAVIDISRQPQIIDIYNERIVQAGERVVSAAYQGQPIDFSDEQQTFIVILDGFMGKGVATYFFLKESPLLVKFDTLGSEVVTWYLTHHSPIRAAVEGRIQLVRYVTKFTASRNIAAAVGNGSRSHIL
ncbi:MAG: 5'-nucleotidase C-terminal domain-containing protein [Chloroflexota bacterium]